MNDQDRPQSRLASLGGGNALTGTESLPDYLYRKEQELVQRTDALRGALAPLESELAQVRKAMRAIGMETRSTLAELAAGMQPPNALGVDYASPLLALAQTNSNAVVENALTAPLPTIKEMTLHALRDHFESGATPSELRDYFRNVYGREIDRNSISPQLARLRDDSMVDMLNDGKWRLSKQGRGIMRYGTKFSDGDTGPEADEIKRGRKF